LFSFGCHCKLMLMVNQGSVLALPYLNRLLASHKGTCKFCKGSDCFLIHWFPWQAYCIWRKFLQADFANDQMDNMWSIWEDSLPNRIHLLRLEIQNIHLHVNIGSVSFDLMHYKSNSFNQKRKRFRHKFIIKLMPCFVG